ncbi:helix-turn-helix domain-containing protein [Pseudomonas mosselii]|uniref:helix-turn-helix domain-containing protein n=1 Tax=Pseudomonas mosselii TaxID=78327 RepID=UPI0021D7F38D|nr:helix-turn-helix transcriptional regulator [Pseudomonas mosselii]MCU9527543.1 helix-turn-helix transcriptional regulator [Pseudomonas mosselii]MCU9534856.1 helix-turn-helix transcriptional regulator [Pseudomonas mosselii]MCU9542790.1 helix-turn-helix transcriptional regulator [Pseudomonas mosselii]MCU9546696.1 helix-turn-helix transcriptional regulator [Pseudomonas mosselii]
MDVIGYRLKSERTRLGFNQTDFGAIGGVRKQAQINYEQGERFPGADYLQAIAKVGADVQFIVTGTVSSLTVSMIPSSGVESKCEQAIRAADELTNFLRNQMPLRAVDLPSLRGLLECVNRMSFRIIEEVEVEHQARHERYRPS